MARAKFKHVPKQWTFGYVDPRGACHHDPPCDPSDLTRCRPQPKQAFAHASAADELFFGGAVGGGKATALDTPIPTPGGFVLMRDLRVSDTVLDEHGHPCSVTWKSPTHIDQTGTYRLAFDDGSVIVAGGQHQWWTMTATERVQEQHRCAEWRAQRRARRPSRGTGKKPWLAVRNAAHPPPTKEPPRGRIRTTEAIAETLPHRAGWNHSIPLAGSWELPAQDLPVDPYVLGLWLGDGTTANGGLTSDDTFIVDAVKAAGYEVTKLGSKHGYYVIGLQTQLRALGVLGNKHVPAIYLWSSIEQRLALLQGLMDTDGCANADGQAEFTNTTRALADAVFHLAVSLGCKPTLTEGTATLYGRVIGPKWTVKWTATLAAFRLPRKLARVPQSVRSTQTRRYIVACERVADVEVQCISVDSPSHLYLAGPTGIPTHNSEYLIIEAITTCLEFPGTASALFRRTLGDLKQHLIERFLVLVPESIARYNASDHVARFFNGSLLWFCHCQHEKDKYHYQSAQWVFLGLDEASHFTFTQFLYLKTRVRSPKPGVHKRIRLASNPGNVGHGWLKRRFVRPESVELGSKVTPQPYEIWRPLPPVDTPVRPDQVDTRQFIPAWFSDNEALRRADPNYLASKVWALGGDTARQLAEGDWDANDSMIVGGIWREYHHVTEADTVLLARGIRAGKVIDWHVIHNRNWRPPVGAHIYGSVDYGYGSPWAFYLHAVLAGGHVRTFFEFYLERIQDEEQGRMIWEAVTKDVTYSDGQTPVFQGLQWIVDEPIMRGSRMEMGLAKSILEVYQEQTKQKIQFMPAAGGRPARTSRPQRWLAALATADDGIPNWSVTLACPHLIRTVPDVPWDANDPNVEDEASENHSYESVGRMFEARPFAPKKPERDPFDHLKDDPISKAHQEALQKKANPAPKVFDISGMVK